MVDFVIAGAQKSGTTSIHRAIEQFYDVEIPREEYSALEIGYINGKFGDVLDDLRDKAKIINGDGKKFGIKRPNLIYKTNVMSWFFKRFPNCKIIVSLRDPVDRALSAYFHYISAGLIPVARAEVGIDKLLGEYIKNSLVGRPSEIIGYSMYAEYLEKLLEFCPKENLIVVDKDAVNTVAGIEALQVSLGLTPQSVSVGDRDNISSAQKVNYSVESHRLLKLHEKMKQYDSVPKDLSKEVRSIALQLWSSQGISAPELPSELLGRLVSLYQPDVRRLEALFPNVASSWKRNWFENR